MMRVLLYTIVSLVRIGISYGAAPVGDTHASMLRSPTHLKVDRLSGTYAQAVGSSRPSFSWIVPMDEGDNVHLDQTHYRIVVSDLATSTDNDSLWDSGVIASNRSHLVEYKGPPLSAFGVYTFSVAWGNRNASSGTIRMSNFSDVCEFGVGPLNSQDWKDSIFVGDGDVGTLRLSLHSAKADPIVRAVAYVAAPGCFVLAVDGDLVNQTKRGICKWEVYAKRRAYSTVDITTFVRESGQHSVDISLGHGMYSLYGGSNHPSPTVLALVKISTESGTTRYVGTRPSDASSWSYARDSFVMNDDPFAGSETNWSWQPKWIEGLPRASPHTDAVLYPMDVPLSVDQEAPLFPQSSRYLVDEYGGPVWVFDFGSNIVGNCEIHVSGTGVVDLRHGETLLNNGSLNLNFSGRADGVKADFQHDIHHIDSNDESLAYRSSFVWYGFQYVAVQTASTIRFNGSALDRSVVCYRIYPDLDSSLFGELHFDDDAVSDDVGARLNSVHSITRSSQLANIAQYAPTDCPTREKHFWLGDALDTLDEAFYNLGPGVVSIYKNFLDIIGDEQDAEGDVPGVVPSMLKLSQGGEKITDISWSAAYPLIAAGLFRHFGDDHVLREHFDSIQRFMGNLYNASDDGLPSFYTWGDWCSTQPRSIATPETGPPAAAANWILSTDAMRDMSMLLNRSMKEQEKWSERGATGRKMWHRTYYNASHGSYGYSVNTSDFFMQTLTSLSLAMGDTVPSSVRDRVVSTFSDDFRHRQYHGTFGSVGQKHVFNQLSAFGSHATALRTATQTSFPSFGYWIENGATTCWENWSGEADAAHRPQPTHNHIFLCGGVGEWMYKYVLGVRPGSPGFATVVFRPSIDSLVGPASAAGKVGTVFGPVLAAWSRDVDSKTLVFNLTSPKPASVEIPVDVFGCEWDAVRIRAKTAAVQGDVWSAGSFRQNAVNGVMRASGVRTNDDGTQRVVIDVLRGIYTFVVTCDTKTAAE